jgi:hypothetical protein
VKKLKLSEIRIDGGTQARVSLNQDVVKEYAEHMRDGEKFPPITVFHDGSAYWLADGFHRYFATKSNGHLEIDADVKTGTLDDATLYAFGANGKRGLSQNPEDYRKIIYAMLRHPVWSKWSNAEIARHVGVSKMTVGRVKATMDLPEETKKKYKDKDGIEREMDTKNLGKKAAPKTTSPDASSAEFVAQDVVSNLNEKIDELSDTINVLADENTLLRDKIAIGQWDASEIEKIDAEEVIANLREQLRVLEIDNKALRDSRDMFQSRNAELMKTVKSLQNKLKKVEQ